jgi:hypothetical protein
MIGLSLSICIMRHFTHNEPLPDRIVAATCCKNREDFEKVLEDYSRYYWRDFAEEARAAAVGYYDTGLLEQPRVIGEEHPGPNKGTFAVGRSQWLILEEHYEVFKEEALRAKELARDH